MKRPVWMLLTLAALALATTILVGGCNEAKALHVNEVGSDPAAYSGTITVVGVTKAFSNVDASVIGIMDLKELQCTTPNCNKLLLPVKYQGTRPAVGDEVRVTGSFTQVQGGYLFIASELKVVRQHQIGG